LKRSLRLASEAIRSGDNLLIFPEGTRARDGVMVSFKPAIGHLCLNERVAIVPMYLGGTHDVLPVGQALPKGRKLWVKIGPAITPAAMSRETAGMSRSAAYRHVAWRVEAEVRRLGGLEPPEALPERAARGQAGTDEDSAEA
jgi:long-chain acyl-CoA synthetase